MTMATVRSDQVILSHEDVTIQIVKRHLSRHTEREYFAYTRVYVGDDLAVARDERLVELIRQERDFGDLRNSTRGEYPAVDRLYNTLNRRTALVKRGVAITTLVAVGIAGDDLSGRFDRYAGCTCPCSPGVILDRTLRLDGYPIDVWLVLQK